jgi:hypothetical protein
MWESPPCDTSKLSATEAVNTISGALVARMVENIIGTADSDHLPLVTGSVVRLPVGRDEHGPADRDQAMHRVLRMMHPASEAAINSSIVGSCEPLT